MLDVTERVDHRNRGVTRHSLDGFLREGPEDDDVDPALEVVSNVAQLLASIEATLRLIHEHRGAAEAGHSSLKRESRSERWLFKKHHHLLARHGTLKNGRARLHQFGQMENRLDTLRSEIACRNQIGAPESARKSFRHDRRS